MRTEAAILVELGRKLEIVELEIPKLKNGQVLVEIAFSGVCHTQILEAEGHRGEDKFLPHCLGHEGTGIVREIGGDVTKVKPGDAVVLSWIKGSGADVPGSVFEWDGRKVNAGAITTFSRFSVISENRLTVLPNDIPLEAASLLGCAAATGSGVIYNNASAQAGQSVAVFGVGGVGCCSIIAAKSRGCSPLIAIDINPKRLELAKSLGATHVVNSNEQDVATELSKIAPHGMDYSVEATGRPDIMVSALQSVKKQTGIAVVIGNARYGEKLCIDPRELNNGKQLRGSWGGETQPDRDFPYYFEMMREGRLSFKNLMDATYALENVNQALQDLKSGKTVRPIISMREGV